MDLALPCRLEAAEHAGAWPHTTGASSCPALPSLSQFTLTPLLSPGGPHSRGWAGGGPADTASSPSSRLSLEADIPNCHSMHEHLEPINLKLKVGALSYSGERFSKGTFTTAPPPPTPTPARFQRGPGPEPLEA